AAEVSFKEEGKQAVGAISFSPDGKTIASAGTDKEIRLWDADTDKDIRTLSGHKNPVATLAFSPDGKQLASAGFGGQIYIHDLSKSVPKLTLAGHQASRIYSVAYSSDGQFLASGATTSWPASGRRMRPNLPLSPSRPTAMAASI